MDEPVTKAKALKKPVGLSGITRVGIQPDQSAVHFVPNELPETKPDIENAIFSDFLRVATNRGFIHGWTAAQPRNPEADYDFIVHTPSGDRAVELMEIAPLASLGVTYNAAPSAYRSYDFAREIADKLQAKSARYDRSTGEGLMLLMYITDWKFALSETALALLQFWTWRETHCFERIFFYLPLSDHDGVARVIFPSPAEFWHGFDPALHRDNVVINLDPRNWSFTS